MPRTSDLAPTSALPPVLAPVRARGRGRIAARALGAVSALTVLALGLTACGAGSNPRAGRADHRARRAVGLRQDDDAADGQPDGRPDLGHDLAR